MSTSDWALIASSVIILCIAVAIIFVYTSRRKNNTVRGLGGWLIWFQLRIYSSVLIGLSNVLLVLNADRYSFVGLHTFIYLIVSIVSLVICLVLFYLKKIAFRNIYLFATMGGVLYYITLYLSGFGGIISSEIVGGIILEIIVCVALFKSARVNNTFTKTINQSNFNV